MEETQARQNSAVDMLRHYDRKIEYWSGYMSAINAAQCGNDLSYLADKADEHLSEYHILRAKLEDEQRREAEAQHGKE